jgi:hypothetical protein
MFMLGILIMLLVLVVILLLRTSDRGLVSDDLRDILRRFIAMHQGSQWSKDDKTCGNCYQPMTKHTEDCIVGKAEKMLKKLD